MATLNATFRIFNGYSGPMNQIMRQTDQVTNKILKASGVTDKFNSKLEATGASAVKASSGLGKFLSIAALIAGTVKGMNVSDTYMNTAARLDLINDGLQTQAELQDKIFAAANRARGSYSDMADAVAKLELLAGDAFSSNDEAIAFTELTQKAFRLSGADTSTQQGALRQLTQAMASGRLQGDELVSISEGAPMLYDAIAKYMGKSKGELKELGSEGKISADIIKNALFMAGGDINAKFETLPMTFGDIWNRIKNDAKDAFSPVIKKISGLINTDKFQSALDKFTVGFEIAAKVAGWLIDVIVDGWDIIGPILGLMTTVYLVSIIAKLWAMIPPLIAQAAAWLAVYWPVLLVIGIIALAIFAARKFGASWEQIISFVGGIIGMFAVNVYNAFVYIWNQVAAFINFFGNVFRNPIAAVDVLFLDLAHNIIGYVLMMAKSIEDLINGIPGVEIDITSGISNFRDKIAAEADEIRDYAGFVEYAKSLELMTPKEGYLYGSSIASDIYNSITDAYDDLIKKMTKGTEYDPLVVEGTGINGKVDVDMSDEDIQYLRDIAERDYINKFSTATLAPRVTFNISDIKETVDVNKLKGTLERMMREEIAIASEGTY